MSVSARHAGALGRGDRPHQAVPGSRQQGASEGRRQRAGGLRHLVPRRSRRDAGSGGRVGQWQDHRRALPAAPDRAHVRVGSFRGHRADHARPQRHAAQAARHADRVPGSAGLARPASDGRVGDRRAAAGAEDRGRPRRACRRAARPRRASHPITPAASRTSSPAVSASASASPARSPCDRSSSCSTSRCRRSTSASRPASSTCCRTCSRSSA